MRGADVTIESELTGFFCARLNVVFFNLEEGINRRRTNSITLSWRSQNCGKSTCFWVEKSIHQACKEIGITDVTYYRLRKEYGGLKGDQVRRLKELEREKQRLKRIVDGLSVEKAILKDAAEGNF